MAWNSWPWERTNLEKEMTIMDPQKQNAGNDMGTLAEDALALLAATADVGGEHVAEARQRLAAALESGKKMYGKVKEKVVEGAKATDGAVHAHPYLAIGVALGVGALVGFLVSRRCTRTCP